MEPPTIGKPALEPINNSGNCSIKSSNLSRVVPSISLANGHGIGLLNVGCNIT